jgi:hypothetical protein
MPWAGLEIEQLRDPTEEGESLPPQSPSEQEDLEGEVDDVDEMQEDDVDGHAEQPSLKRRRIENPQLDDETRVLVDISFKKMPLNNSTT